MPVAYFHAVRTHLNVLHVWLRNPDFPRKLKMKTLRNSSYPAVSHHLGAAVQCVRTESEPKGSLCLDVKQISLRYL